VRHDKSSVHVQGSNAPFESSRIQIMRKESPLVGISSPVDCVVTMQKL